MDNTDEQSTRSTRPSRFRSDGNENENANANENENWCRTLVETSADGMLVVRSDGTIGFANPAARALLGALAGDLVGVVFGVPVVPGETTEIDLPRDGVVRVAEMRAAPTVWQGEPAYLATLRDVTERRQAEEVARQAEAVLRESGEAARRRAVQLQTLAEVSRQLGAALDVDSVLNIVTEQARRLIGAHVSATSLACSYSSVSPITVVSRSEKYQGGHTDPAAPGIDALASRLTRSIRLTQAELESPPDGIDPSLVWNDGSRPRSSHGAGSPRRSSAIWARTWGCFNFPTSTRTSSTPTMSRSSYSLRR